MSKVIVDTQLFITCRLCLEEMGFYQILPEVKDQILFCFDIKVETFDGFSQLICKKCEELLNNYYAIKKKFMSKQLELKSKYAVRNDSSHPIRDVTVNNTADSHVDTFKSIIKDAGGSHTKDINILKNVSGNDASDLRNEENNEDVSKNMLITDVNDIHNKENNDNVFTNVLVHNTQDKFDKKNWRKLFICKFCNAKYFLRKYILAHIQRHKFMKSKFSNIYIKYCQVEMPKIDDSLVNLTGSNNKVVYSQHKIIESHCTDYYVVYWHKTLFGNDDDINLYFDDDTDLNKVNYKRSSKRRRISSSSSNETVVLDEKRNEAAKRARSVTIETTDEDNEKDMNISNNVEYTDSGEDKTVRNDTVLRIISVCRSKYVKKQPFNDSKSTKAIKQKVLSMGRQILNQANPRQIINSTALLRFLEHKHLSVAWVPRNSVNETNSVKIWSRMKNNPDKDKDTVWAYYSKSTELFLLNAENDDLPQNECNESSITTITAVEPDSTLLSLLNNDNKKILNAYPVANPKQLPKKIINPEASNTNVISTQQNTIEDEICMPIITSTTSLAITEKEKAPEISRIKVKPVTELLSAESLNRMREEEPNVIIEQNNMLNGGMPSNVSGLYIVPSIDMSNVTLTTVALPTTVSYSPPPSASYSNMLQPSEKESGDFVILDTPELPNNKTSAPFQYLRSLLQMHNIILLETNDNLNPNFNCLIKFKVLYKQESKDQPVVLCLSLHCLRNVFCIKIRDRNQDEINISKISANWQWEILKIYRGEVVDKVLSNAQRVGADVHMFTTNFFCLLRSINKM